MPDSILGLRFTHATDGRPRAEWPEGGPIARTLISFLEQDVVDPTYAAEILKQCATVTKGGTWKTTGNAFRIEIGPRRVSISPLFGKGRSASLATPTFRQIMKDWQALLKS